MQLYAMISYIVDTFTNKPFKGNPTGVCCLTAPTSDAALLSIANELNFPVTAFIAETTGNGYTIRYFTPVTEIPACWHATLASARVALLEDGIANATFHTTNGIALTTTTDGDLTMMTYPKYNMQPFDISRDLLDGLGLTGYRTAGYCSELEALFLETDAGTLRTLRPDYPRLVQSNDIIKEVVVTSLADSDEHDYLLRSFCPWIGIDEDPVTGSVHTVLAGFWQQRLNKNSLKAYQASQRGGELVVKAFNDKTEIGGKSVVIMKGKIEL